MGWVGVATLIATACVILYYHPPSTWSSDTPFPQQPESDPKPPTVRDAEVKDEPKPSNEDGTDECQTTPKASASIAPSLEVPTLHLEDNKTTQTTATKEQQPEKPVQNESPKPSIPNIPPPPQQPTANSSSLMPPPPPPRLRPQPLGRAPPRPNPGNSLRPPPSAASSLRVPPSRPPSNSNNSLSPIKLTAQPSTASKRAVLEPGFSPLDWAALTSNPNNKLRGAHLPPTLIKVTPSLLKTQNGRKGRDAWTSYQGKVYNITPYLPFHPGGKGELLRGAGKDSAKLFLEVHPWVNWDAILGDIEYGSLG
ncbi:hypothetical protein BDV25DRAFT_135485 [Aspergillus avenaceus]|uniref:Cytochrome b5 heme-binding domain-containing protein n=1 Tax=Aspergillus avenaceus TaxID=36643 RepID=A0A5N6U8A7_ASPAV|nr:hypothetical protein BDV25DRAFT_135485 [Aspergillus avenaceus]